MINAYWNIFAATPGALKFSASGLLGRISPGMLALSIVIPVADQMGSYSKAGQVVASTFIGMALLCQIRGRLVDRFGQRPLLLTFALLNFLTISTFVWCIYTHASMNILCSVGALCGMMHLAISPMIRTRWAYVLKKPQAKLSENFLQRAYAFEAFLDEVAYMLAPLLATYLCISVIPIGGLICGAATYVIGAVSLAYQVETQPSVAVAKEKKSTVLFNPVFIAIAVTTIFMGMAAGSLDVIVTAKARSLGVRNLTGVIVATLAFSSMLGGLWYGARISSAPQRLRWIRSQGFLVLSFVPFVFMDGVFSVLLALFIAGLGVGPASIAGQIFVEKVIPVNQLNEAFNTVGTGMVIGVAAGAWLSGLLIDRFGVNSAGILPAAVTFVALLVALIGYGLEGRSSCQEY